MVAVLRITETLKALRALRRAPELSETQWDQCLSDSKVVRHRCQEASLSRVKKPAHRAGWSFQGYQPGQGAGLYGA